jgi:hypothetical protein
LPISILDNEHFRAMIHSLDPRMTIHTSANFKTDDLPAMKAILMKDISHKLRTCLAFSITLDCWTSGGKSFYCNNRTHYRSEF